MPAARDNRLLGELLEEAARLWVDIDEFETKARRFGFKRDSLKLAKQQVIVLKAQILESMQK